MESDLDFILHRQLVKLDNEGTDVTLKWNVWPAGTAVDPTTQSRVADDDHQPTPQTLVVKAFIYFVRPATVMEVRQNNEIRVGDARLCLDPATVLDGLEDVRFQFDGREWAQFPLGEHVPRSLEGIVQGEKFFRTVWVRPVT